MIEFLNRTQPPPSISSCRRNNNFSSLSTAHFCRVHLRRRLNCCSAYVDSGLKLKSTRSEKSISWVGSRRRKTIMQSLCNTKHRKAISLEIQSPCEEEDDNEGFSENLMTKSEKNICTDELEVYYLEENNVDVVTIEALSKRLLKLSRSNKVRSSLSLYKSMSLSGLLPNSHSCNALLSCLIRNGKIGDALTIFESMRSRQNITGHTYTLILKAVAKFRNPDASLKMFEEAVEEDANKKGIDSIVYNTMIAIFSKVDDWFQAERLWRSMQNNGYRGTVITYRLLICVFVRCGQNELAFEAYHEMIENGITSCNDDAMEAIIGACSREGKWELALKVMQSMLSNGMKPSVIACNALMNSLAKASKVGLAFKVYELMKSTLGHEPDSYTWNSLLVALNRANRHADALRLFESVRRDRGHLLTIHLYNTCLVSCQKLALWDRAVQVLHEMEGSGISVSVTSYNLVIGACEAARKPEVAWQVYEHMVEVKRSPDVFTLLALTRCCVWGSLWSEVEEILNAWPDGSLYNTAIQGMCLRNEADLAQKLYKKMREIGLKPDGKTRSLMLQNLPK